MGTAPAAEITTATLRPTAAVLNARGIKREKYDRKWVDVLETDFKKVVNDRQCMTYILI